MDTVKIYIAFKHCVDLKRPCTRVLRPGDFAHTNNLRLIFERNDFVRVLFVSDKAHALYSSRRIVKHKLDERQSFGATLGIVGLILFVFVGFFLDLRDFSAQNYIVACSFYVDYVVGHLRNTVDFASCVNFFTDANAHEPDAAVRMHRSVDMNVRIIVIFV